MMEEVWYVNGIENYSKYLDWRKSWHPPATLMDYFGKDFLCFIDESHMTFSQIWWMYAWDKARKINLIEAGFRLPSAMDNRPLQFKEFENKLKNIIAVSATPWEYEIKKSCIDFDKFNNFNPIKDWLWKSSKNYRIIPQIMRPTWLLDPEIIQKSMEFMIDDIMKNIFDSIKLKQRVLITTITKRSSEELTDYLLDNWIKVKYLHSEVETLERLDILKELREWKIDTIVWVNLLREWLDLPEVSKVCILDADKQGFLRSTSALIQIIWRAARNKNGKVYMYSEKLKFFDKSKMIKENDWLYRLDKWKLVNNEWLIVSQAMRKAINLTYYRRDLQYMYNLKNNIVPKTIYSTIKDMWLKSNKKKRDYSILNKKSIEKELSKLELEMDIASANTQYEKAIELRDLIIDLKKRRNKL